MPYKIERLKPVYLLILLVTVFSLAFLARKTIFSLIVSNKEGVSVGDVSNETVYPCFYIKYNDFDKVENRPLSVTYNLYNKLSEDEVISSYELNRSSINNNNGTVCFPNLPKYNEDGTKAQYYIKPSEDIPNYISKYNRDRSAGINHLCVEFGDNVFNGDTSKKVSFLMMTEYKNYNSLKYLKNTSNDTNYYYYDDLKNKRICLKVQEPEAFYIEGDINDLDIQRIYPVYDTFDITYGNNVELSNAKYDIFTGDNLPNNSEKELIRYDWDLENGSQYPIYDNSTTIFHYYDKIDLTFDKYWEDEGFENLRPSSSDFYLYKKNNMNEVIDTITLTNDNRAPNDEYHWIGTFDNLDRFDENGNRIEYAIREKEIPNYIQSYDSKEGLSITFNEETDFTRELSAFIFYYNKETNQWYNLVLRKYYGLGNEVGGKTVDIKMPNDSKFQGTSYMNGWDYRIQWTIYKNIKEYTGPVYPEMYHNAALNDNYVLHYNYSLSNHSQGFYFYYSGDSWANGYGLKIDNISTLGDEVVVTSRINLRSLEVTKKWEDENHENERPSSVTIDVLDADDPTKIYKTITMSNSDQIDNYTWKKEVTNLPIYNNNFQEIEYMVSERPGSDKYITKYDADEYYNALELTFGQDLFGFDYVYMGYDKNEASQVKYVKRGNNYNYFTLKHDGVWGMNTWSGDSLSGRKVIIPSRDIYLVFSLSYYYTQDDEYRLKVDDINVVHDESYPNGTYSLGGSNLLKESSYNDYIDIKGYLQSSINSTSYYWRYTWNGSLSPKKNCFVIKNTYSLTDYDFTKKWEDDGYENQRPEEINFYLYNVLDENEIVSIVRLTRDNVNSSNNNEWLGKFKNIPKFNEDGTKAEYFVKEETLEQYKTTYNNSNANGFCIKFNNNDYNDYVYFMIKQDGVYKQISNKADLGTKMFFYPSKMSNKEVCFQTDTKDFYLYEARQYIDDIYPVYREEFDYVIGDNVGYYSDFIEKTRREYNDLDQNYYYYIHYTWNGSTKSFKSANVITNEVNSKNVSFTKEWDDVGYEDNRPTSIIFNLYNTIDENSAISSITLTKDNENLDNLYEWNGVFTNVPKYNNDGSEAQYYVKEENLEKYKTKYNVPEKNGFCIAFTDAIENWDRYDYLMILVNIDGNYRSIIDKNNYGGFYKYNIRNKEVCFQTNTNDFYISYSNPNHEQIINKIYPTYQDDYYYVINDRNAIYNTPNNIPYYEIENNDFVKCNDNPMLNSKLYLHYNWEPTNISFPNSIIINTANMRDEGYIKEFSDTDVEYNRPSELVFGLYVENDPVPKEMTTVRTSSCIDNTCEVNFRYVKDKDSDGNPIEYEIKEISDYGYTVTYEDNKVINTANPVDVKFRKENMAHDLLRGAKFEIYNKSGDKIYEFTSTDRETTIKLLPSEYTIKEVEAPKGYSRIEDITFTVNENGTVIINDKTENVVNIVNEPLKENYDITIKKTLKTNETKDFTFEISIEDFNGTLEYTGDRAGTIIFNNNKATVNIGYNQTITIKDIPVNSVYEIKELGDDYLITIKGNNKGTLDRNENIEFINTPKEIPANGEEKEVPTPITGVFNILSYIAGILLLIGSIFLIIYSKKQIKRS